jgi:hypothetical protein
MRKSDIENELTIGSIINLDELADILEIPFENILSSDIVYGYNTSVDNFNGEEGVNVYIQLVDSKLALEMLKNNESYNIKVEIIDIDDI